MYLLFDEYLEKNRRLREALDAWQKKHGRHPDLSEAMKIMRALERLDRLQDLRQELAIEKEYMRQLQKKIEGDESTDVPNE